MALTFRTQQAGPLMQQGVFLGVFKDVIDDNVIALLRFTKLDGAAPAFVLEAGQRIAVRTGRRVVK